jgi:predicted transcriptional regulator
MTQTALEMTTDLVIAHLDTYYVSSDELVRMLEKTHANLMALKEREDTAATSHARTSLPVDWRKSMTRYTVTCLECGATFKQLSSRHLRVHDLDSRTYRDKYGIPRTQALAARESTARRRRIALESRMWEKAPRYRAARRKARGQRGKILKS